MIPAHFWALDSKHVLYIRDQNGDENWHLYSVDLSTGERTLLSENNGFASILVDNDLEIRLATESTPSGGLKVLSKNGEEWLPLFEVPFEDVQTTNILGFDQDNQGIYLLDSRNRNTATLVHMSLADQALTAIAESDRIDIGSVLDDQPLAKMHGVVIPSRDGMELVSYITLPLQSDPDQDDVPDSPVPMVMLVHGGPWGRDVFGYAAEVQWLANRGYAVLQVNFRSSTGFGKEFLNAGNKQWSAAMHNDLLDAKQWAVGKGITTADKVAIMGGSYGGYATLVGLTFTPDEFSCGVDIVGPSNLQTLLESIPPYWESFRKIFAQAIGDPETEEGRSLLKATSPLTFADRVTKPLLIAQGANDPRVKQAEPDQIVNAMAEKGIPVTYVLFPDEGHGFQKPENSLAFYAVAEVFLAECQGGRYQPLGNDFENSSIQIPFKFRTARNSFRGSPLRRVNSGGGRGRKHVRRNIRHPAPFTCTTVTPI